MLSKPATIGAWIAQIIAAAILGMTLPFKFTYAADSQEIFAQLGGRPAATLIGVFELAAVILLLVPKTSAIGAVFALGIMGGAIGSHVFVIGFEGVAGEMFAMALIVTAAAATAAFLRRRQIPVIGSRFQPASVATTEQPQSA